MFKVILDKFILKNHINDIIIISIIVLFIIILTIYFVAKELKNDK